MKRDRINPRTTAIAQQRANSVSRACPTRMGRPRLAPRGVGATGRWAWYECTSRPPGRNWGRWVAFTAHPCGTPQLGESGVRPLGNGDARPLEIGAIRTHCKRVYVVVFATEYMEVQVEH